MPASSPGPRDLEEMLLPLDGDEPESGPAPPPPPVPAEPSTPRRIAPERSRGRSRGDPPPLPAPEEYAERVLRHLRVGQTEVIEDLGAKVDLTSRQLQGEVTRLLEASTRSAAEMHEAAGAIETSVTGLVELLQEGLRELRETAKEQTAALREEVAGMARSMAASTREAAGNIGVARHELALSVKELKRRTVRYAVLAGGGTGIVVLLAARLLFPFWGMRRSDVEAWSRGTELARTWQEAPPAERQAILRALRWERMPGTEEQAPGPSASSASPAAGR